MLRVWTPRSPCTARHLTATASTLKLRSHYSVLQEPVFESVDVPCGVSAPITIKIHNPPRTTPLPLLLHISPALSPSTAPLTSLALLSPTHTTIHISPPWSRQHPFPTPLHKLLYAYNYILNQHRLSLPPPSPRPAASSKRPPFPPIAVHGRGLGGTLAASLALTEALPHNGPGRHISAVATTDSIFDFSPLAIAHLFPDADEPAIHDCMQQQTTHAHLRLTNLFATPASTLDPFASPLLFFRGPLYDASTFPTSWPPSSPSSLTSPSNAAPSDLDDSPPPPMQTQTPTESPATPPTPKNRSYLKYPPRASGLRLPRALFQITTTPSTPPPQRTSGKTKPKPSSKSRKLSTGVGGSARDDLAGLYTQQARELAAGIRRGVEKGFEAHACGRERERHEEGEGDAEERVGVGMVEGGGGDGEERGAVGVRTWLAEVEGWE